MAAFRKAFEPDRALLVGADGIDLAQFLSRPIEEWINS
ncbi:MAG: AAA family ATPase, partial [Puniceicoccaceae bacterium]